LLGAWLGDELVGHACLYWSFSSTRAREAVLLNDLFVVEGNRGAGVGRALIDAAVAAGRERGAVAVEWRTELDNRRAQRLYERTGAARSAWFEYEIELD
jgi:GNAT superfamily N-acetyltransferase